MKRFYYAYVLDHLNHLDKGIARYFSRDDKFTLANYIFLMVITYFNIVGMPLVVFLFGGGLGGILSMNIVVLPIAVYIGWLHFRKHDDVVDEIKRSYKPSKLEEWVVKIIDKGSVLFFGLSIYLTAQGLPPM